MNCKADLFILAAEASGDLLGADLLSSIKKASPLFKIEGVAGPKMRSFISSPFLQAEEFYVMGFWDVIKAFRRLAKLYKKVLHHLLNAPPKLLILIDYPGFNLRLAKDLKKRGFPSPIVQYVCPTIWAWKRGRIKTMLSSLDHLFCLFPFEAPYFASTSLDVHYVGHPLSKCDALTPSSDEKKYLLLCPGSRKAVIHRNFPLMQKAAKEALKKLPKLEPAILCASEEIKNYICKTWPSARTLTFGSGKESAEIMKKSYLAFATSGTINLELALMGIPSVVIYKLSFLDAFIAKILFRISLPFYCLVNILCQEEIFPEAYGPMITSKILVKKILEVQKNYTAHFHKSQQVKQAFEKKPRIDPAFWVIQKIKSL